ncbi:MAG TPA: hypothetical protein VHF69_12785 [Candidatus Synoicihabitans sp.]|nr:hypothetical protein [Candidatus Synoicihabitans sp.]
MHAHVVLRRGLVRTIVGLLVGSGSFAVARQADQLQVIVNVDLTEAGARVPRPTPERPAYYVPVTFGWQEEGKIIAGEQPPSREELIRQVAQALAREGYVLQALRPNANATTPSLIISLEWGYLNPDLLETGALDLATDSSGGSLSPGALREDPTQSATTDFNQSRMITLVAGSAISRRAQFSEREWQQLRDAVAEGRYFIVLSAYDFEASLRGEQVLLWRARMSTERHGVWMTEVMAALVAAGAPSFGRRSDLPTWHQFPIREGRVEIGPAEVRELDVEMSGGSAAARQP